MIRRAALAVALLGLVAGVTTTPPAAQARTERPWTKVAISQQTLRPGCHAYPFTYRVVVPAEAWMVELTLVSPDGENLASDTFYSDNAPAAGRRQWRVCEVTTRPGVHRVRIKTTAYDGRDQAVRAEPAVRFRLRNR